MKGFLLFLFGALFLIILGTIFSLAGDKSQFLLWLTTSRYSFLDYYFYYITLIGEPLGFIICGILVGFISWRKMLTVPILGLIIMGTSYMLKSLFFHERPMTYLNRLGYQGIFSVLDYQLLLGNHSFPSGHSMAAWALFTLVAAHFNKVWVSIGCLFLAASVSISRVYLVAHFLQDVVAGAVVGIPLGYMVYYIYFRWTTNSVVGSGVEGSK